VALAALAVLVLLLTSANVAGLLLARASGRTRDLLVRTGGEKRLSDFLLWECAYAELCFTERMWPDFGADDLRSAIEEFRRRDRRYGAVGGVQPLAAVPGGAR